MSRSHKPPSPHGTRARYHHLRCRCDACRAANTQYQRDRKSGPQRLISADAVREHLQSLSAAGVGYRSVADVCGISENTVLFLSSGRQSMVRASTAERILGVDQDARADKSLIPSGPIMALIKELTDNRQRIHAAAAGRVHRP